MKVVLFCGGRGVRLLEHDGAHAPKPMTLIGGRPILWHLMTWYATHGHRDFVLCVGFRASIIRSWVEGLGEHRVDEEAPVPGVVTHHFLDGEVAGWRVTVLDSGLDTPVGQRLAAAYPLVADEDLFLANYADGLSDVPMQDLIDETRTSGSAVTMLVVPPPASLHSVTFRAGTRQVAHIGPLADEKVWVNAGFFVMRPAVFGALRDGEDLVDAPFRRLAEAGELLAYPYEGFWRCMDTAKDRQVLEDLWASRERPWAIWESGVDIPGPAAVPPAIPAAVPQAGPEAVAAPDQRQPGARPADEYLPAPTGARWGDTAG